MKPFGRTLLAVIVGLLIFGIIKILFFFSMIVGLASMASSDAPVIRSKSVLRIDLSQPIVDRPVSQSIPSFSLGSIPNLNALKERPLSLYNTIEAIQQAKTDKHIEGIVIQADGFSSGLATINEVREALIDFKSSGKFIYAYSDSYDQLPYYFSTVADSVFLNPVGSVVWRGLAAQILYFEDALKKFGIEAQVVRHGKFKSAAEPFMANEMSFENRLQTKTYLNSMWDYITQVTAKSRDLEPEVLTDIADTKVMLNADSALSMKLVDQLMYRTDFERMVRQKCGLDEKVKNRYVSLAKFYSVIQPQLHKKAGNSKIAVLYASGEIVDTNDTQREIGGNGYADEIARLRQDSTVKAVVLRVNSPGGSALASEIIWNELNKLRKAKPLIVSMGNYAASGGYYISAPATYIYASPLTLTGSIGVFGLSFSMQKLFKDKLGINPQRVMTNPYADMMSAFYPMTDSERAIVQNMIEEVYTLFIKRVAEGRDMNVEYVDEIGQGRVWSGSNSVRLNLVNSLGGLTDAILMAAKSADLTDYNVVSYPEEERNAFRMILEALRSKGEQSSSMTVESLPDPLKTLYALYSEMLPTLSQKGPQARIPYMLDIQ